MWTDHTKVKTSILSSYWSVFRLIFVMFSLFLLKDVFYRWDGFRYYASFSEFLPSVALVTILWTIVSVFTAILAWLLIKAIEWISMRSGWNIRLEHLLMAISFFLFLGVTAWAVKRLIKIQTPDPVKAALLICFTVTALLLTWLFRNKSGKISETVQERITPLVWLFGVWFMISIPLVTYHTLLKQTNDFQPQKTSQTHEEDKSRPNIILITFDALTARDMSVYGYHRQTTPFINEWAKTASLFTNLQAESNITTPATASLMTGKRVWTHQTYHLGGSRPLKISTESLPLVLKHKGYYNMAFIANPYASVKNLDIADSFKIAPPVYEFISDIKLTGKLEALLSNLFEGKIRSSNWILRVYHSFSRLMKIKARDFVVTKRPPEKVFNRFLSELERNNTGPFFAWIHIFPPHFSYLPPVPYMGMFDSSDELRTLKAQMKGLNMALGNPLLENIYKPTIENIYKPDGQNIVDSFRNRYDEFISYCDSQFEAFIKQMETRNKLKNTIIILSSDHGESFEHNIIRHKSPHLYEQVTHIPLIIKEPGQSEGRVINNLAEQIDIPATILDLAEIPVPLWMEGRSLVPLMRGMEFKDKPAFSMYLEKNPSLGHRIAKGTIAVWEGDFKLIYYLEEDYSLLFNLKEDPGELNNLFGKEPEVGKRLLGLIKYNLEKANRKIISGE